MESQLFILFYYFILLALFNTAIFRNKYINMLQMQEGYFVKCEFRKSTNRANIFNY